MAREGKRLKKHESFSGRLTREVVFTVLFIMIIISVIVFFIAAASSLLFSRQHYSDIMDKVNGNMAMIMSKVEVSADNIIDELTWHLTSPEIASEALEYELKTNSHLKGCGMGFLPDYFPEQGRWFEPYALNGPDGITVRNIGSETHDYFSSEWYVNGLASSKGVWSNPYLDMEGAGTVLCTFSRQVPDPNGNIAGVIGADISLDGLSSLIWENINRENDASPFIKVTPDQKDLLIYCFIIGPNGDFIVHPDRSRILRTNFYDFAVGKGAAKYRALGDAMCAGKEDDMIVMIDGMRVDVYFAPLQKSGWSMAIVVPMKRLMRPGYIFGSVIILLILLGLLVVFLTCKRSIRRAATPLIQLTESAKEVARGKFDVELPQIETNDEIRLLRDSFDNMQQSLAQYVEELTETTAQKATMESELSVARNIQMSMLPMTWPPFPDRNDLDIFGSITPAKAVGGDLYDFHLRDNKLFFCIGDVSGKGIPAALVMAVINSMFGTLAETENNPARIVSSLNASMAARNESMMFVTLFVGVLDLATGDMRYTNAGHNAPFIVSDGVAKMLDVDPNIPVGIMEESVFTLQETTLSPGEVLFLYTDGLSEATRSDGQLFGDERAEENLSHHGKENSANEIISHMTEAVNRFVGDAEQSDDLTMLALKLLSK